MNKENRLFDDFNNFLSTNNDVAIKQHLPKLLNTYLKNAQRLEKILKQGDSQLFNIFKIKESLEEANQKLNMLLNNAGQGFLYFNSDMIIGSEYSKGAYSIFEQDITNLNITKLLYYDNQEEQLFLESTLKSILLSDEIQQEILLSLLNKNFIINKKNINIDYKIIDNENFMLILTDITTQITLDEKIKQEKQTLKMIVEVVSSTEQFLEVKQSYQDFILDIHQYKSIAKLPALRMQVHTFKGLFAQKEILNIVEKLHELENQIDLSIQAKQINDVIANITSDEMYSWIKFDIETLTSILGKDFFDKTNYINIQKQRLYDIEKLAQKYKDPVLLEKIKNLSLYHIEVFIKPYINIVEQLSKKLDKSIYPLIFNSDEIYVEDKYKPFLTTLVHIFRNSVDHGIETSTERINLKKDPIAKITCSIKSIHKQLIIEISDDGKGIDIEHIKTIAINKKLYTKSELELFSKEDIIKIIFDDNFSTATNITDISGRGVGLASVMYELNALNGTIKIENQQGYGIKFIFIIPYIK